MPVGLHKDIIGGLNEASTNFEHIPIMPMFQLYVDDHHMYSCISVYTYTSTRPCFGLGHEYCHRHEEERHAASAITVYYFTHRIGLITEKRKSSKLQVLTKSHADRETI